MPDMRYPRRDDSPYQRDRTAGWRHVGTVHRWRILRVMCGLATCQAVSDRDDTFLVHRLVIGRGPVFDTGAFWDGALGIAMLFARMTAAQAALCSDVDPLFCP